MIGQGSSRNFIWSIVAAQVLVQIGAFTLPALLWRQRLLKSHCALIFSFAIRVARTFRSQTENLPVV